MKSYVINLNLRVASAPGLIVDKLFDGGYNQD